MSCNYSEGLSKYVNKGILGIDEVFDDESVVKKKCNKLVEWLKESQHTVVHTGAGISTSAGIPDFRGPKGVWTLEKKGIKPEIDKDFNETVPTKTHMALKKLIDENAIHFIVSQNIDGLHLKSGVPREKITELHGNMFVDKCNSCDKQFIRNKATTSVGQKKSNVNCPVSRFTGRKCKGQLHDTILDWEHDLPQKELQISDMNSAMADLSICLGTTLQIVPSGTLPLKTKESGGKLVIINLQPTKFDSDADLVIHDYVDDVMTYLMKRLNLKIPEYDRNCDPTQLHDNFEQEWTLSANILTNMRKKYKEFSKSNTQLSNKKFKTDK